MNKIKKILMIRESTLLLTNAVLILVLSLMFNNFSTITNFRGILFTVSANAIIATVMTILFVSGGFDFSAGVIMGLAGIIIGRLIVSYNLPIALAIILVLVICAIIGSIMGYIISYLNINPFFVTLAGYFIISSVTPIISSQENISRFPDKFGLIARFEIFGIPLIILFSLVFLIFFDILLRKNIYFRQNYAIGGNELGAFFAGIKVKKIKMLNYILVSTMAGVGGIFFSI